MIPKHFGRRKDITDEPQDNTTRVLTAAGWHKGRSIDIDALVAECEASGVHLTDVQKRFISEFGGIKYSDEKKPSQRLFISDKRRALFSDDDLYFVDITKDPYILDKLDDGDIDVIVAKYGSNTVCVGNCYYYDDPILLGENGTMFVLNCGWSELGSTPMEALCYLTSNWG